MGGELFEDGEFGYFGICADERLANHQRCVHAGKLLDERSYQGGDRVGVIRYSEKNLDPGGVILDEPASQAFFRLIVTPFKRFKDGDGGERGWGVKRGRAKS
jgi:hypothetical protein